ncbi:MAG TPA: lipid-binding SYLF domain-containing protein [Bryobacteraceae bacterium]|jgi:lipid-binding SYLF domain-containing protein|nr:lipid-binding SYLF domain-containing protein [Bryobacteraceae bacterium]
MRKIFIPALAAIFLVIPALALAKPGETADRLDAATDLLTDMMKASDKGVPQDLMNRADCVILVPNLKKAAFLVGGKYGRGFAFCRRAGGTGWSGPAAIRIEGGSFGLQIGGSEQDVLLLVMNQTGMKRLLGDKFTLGGEASAAAGPLGREASAQTDAAMRAEMLSYSRSRGLFAGLSLQGATLRPDADTNVDLYGHAVSNREILTGGATAPQSAAKLESLLNKNSSRRNN